MRTLQSILGGLTATGTLMVIAWCSGMEFQRGPNLGFTMLISILIGFVAGWALSEGGKK